MKQVFNENAPRGHYSPAMIHNGVIYVSGQTSADPKTGFPPSTFEEEMLIALNKMESVLNAAGVDRNSVIKCQIYLSDMSLWNRANEVYQEFFKEHKPARIVLPVGELNNGCKVELDVVAAMDRN